MKNGMKTRHIHWVSQHLGRCMTITTLLLLAACNGGGAENPTKAQGNDIATNQAPIADAGQAATIIVGANVTLDGSGSSDPENQPLSFNWSFTARPQGSTSTLQDGRSARPSFTADLPGDYRIRLIVNDGEKDSLAAEVVITATPNSMGRTNQPPVADAGRAATVIVGANVTLDGSGSSDPENQPLSFNWSFTARPQGSTSTLQDGRSARPSFTADLPGDYRIRLIVNDGEKDSLAAEVVITATPNSMGRTNQPPVADAGRAATVIVGANVTLDGSGSSDPENQPLSFNWSFTARPQGSTSTLQDDRSARPSFTADLPGDYRIRLIVNDGASDSPAQEVTITVVPHNQQPFARAGADQIVAPGTTISVDGSASSDPDGDRLSYSWAVIRPDGVREQSISYKASADYTPDMTGDYIFELMVRDNGLGEYKDTDETRITVASRIITLTWPANGDAPSGYAVYAGPDTSDMDNLVRILSRDGGDWDPANPSLRLGWESVLRAAGLPLDATRVCLGVRAYNGFGLSPLSATTCVTNP